MQNQTNVAQDDEQHNAALRRRNHEKTQQQQNFICENHLYLIERNGKKDAKG